MSKFIYVFTKEGKRDMEKRGYMLLKSDDANQIWVFANKEDEGLEFTANFQCVLSDTLTF